MASWIQEKAAQVKRTQEQQEKAREWQLHEAEVIRSRGREVLEELETVIQANVTDWNAQFQDAPEQRIDGMGKSFSHTGGFLIRKTYFPASTVEVWFDSPSMSISYEAIKNRMIGQGHYTANGRFHVKLSENGGLYITNNSYEHLSVQNVAQQIIEQVIGN